MSSQKILIASENYVEVESYLKENGIQKFMLVCDSAFTKLSIHLFFNGLTDRTGIEFVTFSEFQPNPLYESVVKGVEIFRKERCQALIAVGGGSAMDVAKCIKLYSNMDSTINYLHQTIVPNDIKILAVPTTAGTGSEATRYAVIYYKGTKQSVSDSSCIPSTVLLDVSALKTLPLYQKKATMMDALCHAIEAFWSINSTDESKNYSEEAIKLIFDNKDGYLLNKEKESFNMLKAANLAGKAINITQTTAGHAMSYKLTSLYGIAHGHAVAICMVKLFPYMVTHSFSCIDSRGEEYLKICFDELARIMDCENVIDAIKKFTQMVKELNFEIPLTQDEDYIILKKSVNSVRLRNNPVQLDEQAIDALYHEILRKG